MKATTIILILSGSIKMKNFKLNNMDNNIQDYYKRLMEKDTIYIDPDVNNKVEPATCKLAGLLHLT